MKGKKRLKGRQAKMEVEEGEVPIKCRKLLKLIEGKRRHPVANRVLILERDQSLRLWRSLRPKMTKRERKRS